VPELVARWLDATPTERAQRVDGSLFFADLSGFTALSERLARLGREGAEQLTDVVDAVFSELITIADQASGQLLSFGGDALLLLFTGDQHARRAARTAHTIRSQVRRLGRQRTGVGQVRLRVSIGVHSGTFDALLVGGEQRLLLIAGADVSEAVKAEHAAGAGQIAVTEQCARWLPPSTWRRASDMLLLTRSPSAPDVPRVRSTHSVDVSPVVPGPLRSHIDAGVDLLQHRRAAVAFVHIGGLDDALSTDQASTLSALDRIVSSIHDACRNHDVCCLASDVDTDGVKVILTAGVPTTSGDDEERLILALLELFDEPSPLPRRAGVHRGPVFAGTVGPPSRRTFTIMGDTVNVAARVMARATPGQVLVSVDALDHCRAEFTTGEIVSFRAKGKKAQVRAAPVVGRADGESSQASDELAMVGRERELAILLSAWRRSGQDGTTLVEVVGEPGIGKSTLLAAFESCTGAERRFRLRGDLYTRTTPYRGLRSLVQQAAELPDPGPALNEAVGALGRHLTPRWSQLMPLLNDVVLSTLPETDASRSLSPEVRRRNTIELVQQILAHHCPGQTLFILEDTHWFDDATSEWLLSLASPAPGPPWCLVSTRRPVEGGFTLDPDVGSHLALAPLGDEAAVELIRAERGNRPAPPQLVRTIAARAAGNPLFLRELVRALGAGDDAAALPGSLDALLTARLDQLAPTERHLVCRASVLGQRFARDLLPVVLDPESSTPSPHLLDRVSEFVAPVPGGRLGFTHAMIRDAAYQLLPYRTRRELHRQVAHHLSRGADVDQDVLSYHYLAAQEWNDAWTASRSAADAALASHAPVEAADLLERAVQAGRHLPGLPADELLAAGLELSRSYERSGRFENAERTYRRLAPLATTPLARARVKIQLAWLAERQSKLQVAIRRSRAATALLAAPSISTADREAAQAEARTVEGMALEVSGKHAAAAQALSEAVTLARRQGQPRTEAQAASILDWALAMSGQLDEPVHLTRALDLYRELGDVAGEASCLTNLGALAYLDGRWSEAVEFYRQGQSAHMRAGDETSAALGAANTGEVLSDQGHWDTARAVLGEALDVWRSTGHEHGVAYAEGLLGRAVARSHDFDAALALLDRSRGRHLSVGAKGDAAQVWLWWAEAQCLRGETEQALRCLDDGADDGSAAATRIRATAVALVDRTRGLAALHQARTHAEEQGEHFEVVCIDHTSAVVDPTRAADYLQSSSALATQLGIVQISRPQPLI
jgi:class 3 adenylate cyclase/tetratricopeptide (TPR) repeat protein